MSRKPQTTTKVHDVNPANGETTVTDAPAVEMPQPEMAKATDPNNETALSTGTVATIGHNQPGDAEALPSAETVHNNILSVVQDITRHHGAIENATQRLAYLLGQRHAVLQGLRMDGSLKSLAELAENTEAFEAYWTAVLEEFVGPAIEVTKAATHKDAVQAMSRVAWNNRCKRALELICYLAWCGIDYTAFDHDKAAFPVKPVHLCPPGYVPGTALSVDYSQGEDKPQIRTVVYLGDNSGRDPYYIGYPSGRQYPINASIAQIKKATYDRIKAAKAQRAGQTRDESEASPGREKRKAAAAAETNRSEAAQRQADADRKAAVMDAEAKAAKAQAAAVAAANASNEAAGIASLTPNELGEMPTTADGAADREKLIAAICAQAMSFERLIANDLITTIQWSDLTPGAQNALAVAAIWFDRLKGDADHDATMAKNAA